MVPSQYPGFYLGMLKQDDRKFKATLGYILIVSYRSTWATLCVWGKVAERVYVQKREINMIRKLSSFCLFLCLFSGVEAKPWGITHSMQAFYYLILCLYS